jgi:GMP synthase-like glutamine amidotransferase
MEIGWFPVERTADAARSPLFASFPERLDAFHWHGDTFSLPDGAVHAARSAACRHQAFSWGDRVAALQFHPEMTPSIASALVETDAADLALGGACIQTPTEILASVARFEAMRPVLWDLLDTLAGIPGNAEP